MSAAQAKPRLFVSRNTLPAATGLDFVVPVGKYIKVQLIDAPEEPRTLVRLARDEQRSDG